MCSHQESESKSVSLTTLETPLLRWEPQRVAGTSSQAAAKRSADMAPHSEIWFFPVIFVADFLAARLHYAVGWLFSDLRGVKLGVCELGQLACLHRTGETKVCWASEGFRWWSCNVLGGSSLQSNGRGPS